MDTAQLLRDMGIDVWRARLRAAGPSAVAEAPRQHEAQPAPPEPSARKTTPATVRREPPATSMPTRPPAGSAQQGTGTTARRAAPPFTVLCAQTDAALLLAELSEERAAGRFVRDVLAAAGGGPPRTLVFEWPQRGIDADAVSAARALRAFCARQLDETPARVLLVGADVLERVGDLALPENAIVLAPLGELMVDGARKRALWQALKQRLGTAERQK